MLWCVQIVIMTHGFYHDNAHCWQVEGSEAVDGVRLEVLDNHGHDTFTCLYHLRMYGDP